MHKLEHNMINLSTEFEISMFTHYGDMKGNEKCRNWGGFGRLEVMQGHWQHNRPIEEPIRFSIAL